MTCERTWESNMIKQMAICKGAVHTRGTFGQRDRGELSHTTIIPACYWNSKA